MGFFEAKVKTNFLGLCEKTCSKNVWFTSVWFLKQLTETSLDVTSLTEQFTGGWGKAKDRKREIEIDNIKKKVSERKYLLLMLVQYAKYN